MKELVDKLIRLQQFDIRLKELKLQKGDLPLLIENLSEDFDDKKQSSESLQEKTSKLKNDRSMFEKETEASKQQLKKYQEQLYHVKNNKEYDAISLEIDTKKAEIEGLENKIIQTLEEEETLKHEISELKEELTRLDDQLAQNRSELDEITEQTEAEEKQLLKKRDAVAKMVDDRYLRVYERIHKAKDGVAVATIKRSSCGYCYSVIPPQKVVEIRKADRLHTCEHCGIFLVWADE